MKLVIHPNTLQLLVKSRRGSKAFAKLLPLLDTSGVLYATYEEMARLLGYRTRSGCYKAVKKLIELGVVNRDNDIARLELSLGRLYD